MIPVQLASEPRTFNRNVRQKGLSAIDEMVGRPPRQAHPGPRQKRVAAREEDIPAGKFPAFWRDALSDLLQRYGRRCAFLALYLEHATGNASVDHMLPKARRWDRVYEWDNFRLCASSINSLKSDMTGLIDPFECQREWFALELVGFQIVRGRRAPPAKSAEIDATLELLNAEEFRCAREEYAIDYASGDIRLDYLERRAPFIAQELRRQGRLRPGDH